MDGYIREFSKKCNDILIPTEITLICLDYFYESWDRFSSQVLGLEGTGIVLSEDQLSVTKTTTQLGFCSVFGESLIESMDNDIIYSWTFKIHQQNGYFPIGITTKFVHDFGVFGGCYIYNCYSGSIMGTDQAWQGQYGPKLKADDRVKMVLNMHKGHLSYFINDKPVNNESKFNQSDMVQLHLVILKK